MYTDEVVPVNNNARYFDLRIIDKSLFIIMNQENINKVSDENPNLQAENELNL
jgi:hypothetical protein